MKYTWEEIIESNTEYIDLIGYGSILNQTSHEGDVSLPQPVVVHGFQRIYNLKMAHPSIDNKTLENFRKKYWEKYNIKTLEEAKKLREEKYCVLNCIYTGNIEDVINGVVIRIPRKDFEIYQKREKIYDLYQTNYSFIDPNSGETTPSEHRGYILSAQANYIIDDGFAFLPYHNFSRQGAYHYGEFFGKMFDATTKRVERKE